ncbi:MAG: flagellar hook-associated protein FlgK [Myxococcales bacterium]|nr:flagellar hook-associated protein FlgK [Myxococcales bacterium]
MTLLSALNTAGSGVFASRAGVQLTGHNIANVSTEGFHRRRLGQTPAAIPALLGGGVIFDGGTRVDDRLLTGQLFGAKSQSAFADARESQMVRLEGAAHVFGEGGLAARLDDLFAAFSSLSSSPSDDATRQRVISAAEAFSQSANQIASDVEAVAGATDQEISLLVQEANGEAAAVAALNTQILAAEADGHEASDLRDLRDGHVKNLVDMLGATAFTDGSGHTTVLVGGQALVQGEIATTLSTAPSASYGGRRAVQLVSSGGSTFDITGVVSGRVGGLVSVRDGDIPDTLADLDQLVFDVAQAINTQHRAGFGLDGVSGRDLFATSATASGAAAALSVASGIGTDELAASATAGGVPGDGSNAMALANLASANVAAGGTRSASAELSSITGNIGARVSQASADADLSRDSASALEMLEQSSEGVSLDEEMVRLIQYQRAYQASTRVLQVVDEMLGELMAL